jgi:hypothetical protein
LKNLDPEVQAMVATPKDPYFSPDEYLQIEEQSSIRPLIAVERDKNIELSCIEAISDGA